jgi:hypothetical protein
LAIFAVMPHHHHGEAICTTEEHCRNDHSANGLATPSMDNDHDHCRSCIVRSDYLVVAVHNESRCKGAACDHPSHSLPPLPALLPTMDSTWAPALLTGTVVAYATVAAFCPLSEISRHSGLRAPPCFFV